MKDKKWDDQQLAGHPVYVLGGLVYLFFYWSH
jgi:hypothetical protein